MKKLALLTLAVVLSTTGLFAMDVTPEEISKEDVRSQIVKLLDNPEFAVERDFNVEVQFTFSSEGEIVVLGVSSSRVDVKQYIRDHINYKKLENPGVRNRIYTMPLKVKAL